MGKRFSSAALKKMFVIWVGGGHRCMVCGLI